MNFFLFVLSLSCLFILFPYTNPVKLEKMYISKEDLQILDAGTIKLERKKIKLYGIDALDKTQKCVYKSGENKGKSWNCGENATIYLTKLLSLCSMRYEGHTGIECWANIVGEDSNKIRLGKITIGKVDVNEMILKNGWAPVSEDATKE